MSSSLKLILDVISQYFHDGKKIKRHKKTVIITATLKRTLLFGL